MLLQDQAQDQGHPYNSSRQSHGHDQLIQDHPDQLPVDQGSEQAQQQDHDQAGDHPHQQSDPHPEAVRDTSATNPTQCSHADSDSVAQLPHDIKLSSTPLLAPHVSADPAAPGQALASPLDHMVSDHIHASSDMQDTGMSPSATAQHSEPERSIVTDVRRATVRASPWENVSSQQSFPVSTGIGNTQTAADQVAVLGVNDHALSQSSGAVNEQVGAHATDGRTLKEESSIPDGDLSQRERALRSLSSKGLQLGRSASGKASRLAREGSNSGAAGKLPLERWEMQNSSVNNDTANRPVEGNQSAFVLDGINGPVVGIMEEELSQRAKAVRALSFHLDLETKSRQ